MQVSKQHATLLLEELNSTQETGWYKETHISSSVPTCPGESSTSSS